MVNPKRWKQRYQNFHKAYVLLTDGVSLGSYDALQEAGLIQTFQFTFELAWKTMKDYLELAGFDIVSPRDTIKQAFQAGYISDGQIWLEALDKRNMMSHMYDQAIAQEAILRIKTQYYPLITEIHDFFGKLLETEA